MCWKGDPDLGQDFRAAPNHSNHILRAGRSYAMDILGKCLPSIAAQLLKSALDLDKRLSGCILFLLDIKLQLKDG